MEKNVLNGFQSFLQHPDYYLLVNSDSNYFYIEKENNSFITTRMVNVTMEKINGLDNIVTKESYHDVLDGDLVHERLSIYSVINNKEYSEDNTEIHLLSDILNINGNKKSYLTIEDIDTIVNYEKEEPKVYKKK